MTARRLILASTSARRRELIGWLEVPFTAMSPGVDEPTPPPGTDGPTWAIEMARLKADAAVTQLQESGAISGPTDVLASDTVVQVGAELLGKPVDRADAIRTLTLLSGSTHIVASSWCLVGLEGPGAPPGPAECGVGVTRIVFRDLDRAEIEVYVDSGESFGKAGAYAVQETGDRFVARIDGDFTTVVGLPLPDVADLLAARGYPVIRPDPDRR